MYVLSHSIKSVIQYYGGRHNILQLSRCSATFIRKVHNNYNKSMSAPKRSVVGLLALLLKLLIVPNRKWRTQSLKKFQRIVDKHALHELLSLVLPVYYLMLLIFYSMHSSIHILGTINYGFCTTFFIQKII